MECFDYLFYSSNSITLVVTFFVCKEIINTFLICNMFLFLSLLEITTGYTYVARIVALQKWKNRAGTCSTYKNLLQICVQGEWHDSAMIIIGLFKDSAGKFQLLCCFKMYFSHD